MAAKDAQNNNIADIISVFDQVGINLNTDCNKKDSPPDVPYCPFITTEADLPCHKTKEDGYWMAVNLLLEKETMSFAVTNTSASYLPAKLEVAYYENCSISASPSKKTLEYTLAKNAKQIVTVNSNCASQNATDDLKKISIMLISKEKNPDMVLSRT